MRTAAYPIPDREHQVDTDIKRSQFITYIQHTPDIESAKAFVEQIKQKHSDANHNCWAFVAGAPDNSQCYGFSDDGEPSGTAGKPMLAVLMGSGIGEITAVVTRYFGGIKLGTGGLVKAYAGCVKLGLAELPVTKKVLTHHVQALVDYEWQGILLNLLNDYEVFNITQDYGERITLNFDVAMHQVDEVMQRMIDVSAANVSPCCLTKNQS